MKYRVAPCSRAQYADLLLFGHYARRIPSVSFAFGLFEGEEIIGVVTFGTPASRHMQIGACPSDPSKVIELNRLYVKDCAPRNTESWFLARALNQLPPKIIVSYADTAQGHIGIVYRASNFFYAGWTDMDRKTPRFDYVVPGKHSREAFRSGLGTKAEKIRRQPKIKYWMTSGDRRSRTHLEKLCALPKLDWASMPPPSEGLRT